MQRFFVVSLAIAMFVVPIGASAARTGMIEGVLRSYISGNEGTDVMVKTSDGRTHRLWFDNLKKPTFEGKQLPWCPDFPCHGWPKQLVLGKTRVRVTFVVKTVDGVTVDSPTKVDLIH